MNALTAGNIQLIKSIRAQYLDKVQNAVMQAMVRGSLNKDLAAQIKDLGKTTEKRAMFIARDQSSKLNAALTQARHEEVGIKKYMWSASLDERVRESHAEKDGQIFEYSNPQLILVILVMILIVGVFRFRCLILNKKEVKNSLQYLANSKNNANAFSVWM